jgi:hypothetical protein
MTNMTMARGEVLTGSSETNRFIWSNAIRRVDLDSLSITDSLISDALTASRGAKAADLHKRSAVSSVVEHYLDTVGVTGSNPVSRTTFRHHLWFLLLRLHELTDERCNLICIGIKGEVSGIENVNLGFRHVLGVTLRFAAIE